MVVLIDNYDSFTYNLVHYLQELGEEVNVIEACQVQDKQSIIDQASHLIISPGPGHPNEAKESLKVIRENYQSKPILGVCLGHQCIAISFGGVVEQGVEPVHGKTSKLTFVQNALFDSLPQGLEVMRYHSLIVSSLSNELEALAWSEDGVLMALRHTKYPLYGVQFHPESILTSEGRKLLSNFLKI